MGTIEKISSFSSFFVDQSPEPERTRQTESDSSRESTINQNEFVMFSGTPLLLWTLLSGCQSSSSKNDNDESLETFTRQSAEENTSATDSLKNVEKEESVYQEVQFYENGQIKSAYLKEDQVIQGFYCSKDEPVSFYENGQLQEALLVQEEVAGLNILPGTKVQFYENGQIKKATLGADQMIYAIKVLGGTDIRFYENGTLTEITIGEDVNIEGHFVRRGTTVYFNRDGSFDISFLKQPWDFDGIEYASQYQISFYEQSGVKKGALANPETIQGLHLKPFEYIEFYEDYSLKSGVLQENSFTPLSKDDDGTPLLFQSESLIELYPNGQIRQGQLAGSLDQTKKIMISEVAVSPGHDIGLYENSQLAYGTLWESQVVQGVPLRGQSLIGFYDDGTLFLGVLAKNFQDQKMTYQAGSEIELSFSGGVRRGTLAHSVKYENLDLKAGMEVEWDEGDNLKYFRVGDEEMMLHELRLPQKTKVWVQKQEDHIVYMIEFGEAVSYQDKSYQRGTWIVLQNDGQYWVMNKEQRF